MPRARDSGDPRATSQVLVVWMLPSAALTTSASRWWNDFGAEPSRPAFLLCTLQPVSRPTRGNTRYRPAC